MICQKHRISTCVKNKYGEIEASSFYGGGGGHGFEDVDGMTSYFGECTLGASFLDSSMATGATGSNKNSQTTKNTQTTKNSKTTSDNKTVHTYPHSANSSSYYGDGTSITTDLKSLDVSIHEINDQNQSNNVSGSEPRYLSDKRPHASSSHVYKTPHAQSYASRTLVSNAPTPLHSRFHQSRVQNRPTLSAS